MNVLLTTTAEPQWAPFSTAEKRPPLGLGFLLSVLREHGHRAFFSDEYLRPSDALSVESLARDRIDVVGIYANTICYENTLRMVHHLDGLRRSGQWSGRIILGGPHTSVALDTVPDFVDHVVQGEGEISLPKILDGTVRDRVVVGEQVKDLDTLPFPAWDQFIHRPYDWSCSWTPARPVYPLNTSRGCPFKCTFCSVKGVWGKSYRAMSADRVLDDVGRMVRDYGMRVAYFREDHFTLSKSRTSAFCKGLIDRGWGVDWICESRVDSLDDPEYVRLLARSGCIAMYVGVESGSPRMLEFFKKGETVEQFERAFRLLREAGIKTYASFVVGAPTETEQDLRQTFALVERIRPDFHCMNVYVGLPGSEMYDYAKAHDLVAYEDPFGVFYLRGHDDRVDRFYGGDPVRKIPYARRRAAWWLRRRLLAGKVPWREVPEQLQNAVRPLAGQAREAQGPGRRHLPVSR